MNVFDFNNMREFFVVTHVKNPYSVEVSHETEYFFSKREAEEMAYIYLKMIGEGANVCIYHIKDGCVVDKLYLNDRYK